MLNKPVTNQRLISYKYKIPVEKTKSNSRPLDRIQNKMDSVLMAIDHACLVPYSITHVILIQYKYNKMKRCQRNAVSLWPQSSQWTMKLAHKDCVNMNDRPIFLVLTR
jgi:hypothetical protein